jgi:hypothetical protein
MIAEQIALQHESYKTNGKSRQLFRLHLFGLCNGHFGHYIAPNQPEFKGHDW